MRGTQMQQSTQKQQTVCCYNSPFPSFRLNLLFGDGSLTLRLEKAHQNRCDAISDVNVKEKAKEKREVYSSNNSIPFHSIAFAIGGLTSCTCWQNAMVRKHELTSRKGRAKLGGDTKVTVEKQAKSHNTILLETGFGFGCCLAYLLTIKTSRVIMWRVGNKLLGVKFLFSVFWCGMSLWCAGKNKGWDFDLKFSGMAASRCEFQKNVGGEWCWCHVEVQSKCICTYMNWRIRELLCGRGQSVTGNVMQVKRCPYTQNHLT